MTGHFLDVLLPDVLDHLELGPLLLCAMPVSRYWREQACAHPTYWRDIKYTGRDGYIEVYGPQQYGAHRPRYAHSRDLFLLRLSRTCARPIDVAVCYADPDVLSAIGAHLSHTRSLSVDLLARHWPETTDILCETPAPLLEFLSLHSQAQQSNRPNQTLLPFDLFAGQPAALKQVVLSEVGLPSAADLPACFSSITSLIVHNSHPSVQRALPNVFRQCLRLKKLWIYYGVTLEDPEFRNEETWWGLEELGLHFLACWDVLSLPISNVPRIVMSPSYAEITRNLISWLGSRLTVEIPPLRSGIERSPFRTFHVHFGVFGDTTSRRRSIQMRFPSDDYEPPECRAITVLREAVLSERVVELALAIQNWDLLAGFLAASFPLLRRLVLFFANTDSEKPLPSAAGATLTCPRILRIVLRAHPGSGPATLDAADVFDFVRQAVRDVPHPVAVETDGVTLRGSLPGGSAVPGNARRYGLVAQG